MKIENIVDVISMNTGRQCDEITLARSIIDDDEYLDMYLSSDNYNDFEMKVLSKECALNEIYAQISRYGKRANSHWVGLWSCLENMALKYIQNLVDF